MGLKVFAFKKRISAINRVGQLKAKIAYCCHEEFNTVSPSFFVVTFRRAFSTRVRAR